MLVYELLVLIRGTRAVQMALGASFLIGLYFLSQWLELETVNWVIRNLATYVVFAIIVLFQSDIRRALLHFGRARSSATSNAPPAPRRRSRSW